MRQANRPECFEFAMMLVGDPEAPEVERYVAGLERSNERLVEALRNVKFGLEQKLVGSEAFTLESMIEGVSKALSELGEN